MEDAKKVEKRERILDAAVTEIAAHGYYNTTVAMIARRAGVADGTIYLYFESKQAILVAIFEHPVRGFDCKSCSVHITDLSMCPFDSINNECQVLTTIMSSFPHQILHIYRDPERNIPAIQIHAVVCKPLFPAFDNLFNLRSFLNNRNDMRNSAALQKIKDLS